MTTGKDRFQIFDTREGPAAVVAGPRGVRAVLLPGLSRRELRDTVHRRFPEAVESDRGLRTAVRAIQRYFETGRLPPRTPRLDLRDVGGLRLKVYEALRGVPAGETVTYGELARRIGHPGAHRSVGTALRRNPLPLFVPCHRVLRSDGGLGGFSAAGGLDLKRRMLALEAAGGGSPNC